MGSQITVFALCAALVIVAGCAFSIHRRVRLLLHTRALSDRFLYEQGKQAAQTKREENPGAIERLLREAGVEAAPLTWMLCVAAVLVAVGVFFFKAAGMGAAVAGVLLACVGVALYLLQAKRKRRDLMALQFVRLLPQLSASVRSAQTVERAFRASAERAQEPIRSELARVLAQVSYGEPLVAALEGMAQRTGSEDVAAFAASMRIQQRFGGPVNKVVDLVSDHANERMKTQRELKTELAGTRLATWVVACAMPAIFALMYTTSPDFALFYSTEPLGWLVLSLAVLMEIIGVIACRKITTFCQVHFS